MSCLDKKLDREVLGVLAELGGAESLSLLDWPGKLAMVLFFSGCNFACPWCHNKTLIPFPDRLAEEESLARGRYWARQIQSWAGLCDAVVLSGGEATCQEGLGQVVEWLKGRGLLVKLDTNGSRPGVLEALLEKPETSPDMVAMDIKAPLVDSCGAPDPQAYARAGGGKPNLKAIGESLEILTRARESGKTRVVWRTTWLDWFGPETEGLIRRSLPQDAEWTRQDLVRRSNWPARN